MYGWFWGRFLDRSRVLLLIKKDETEGVVEIPSDAMGIEYFTWNSSLAECETVIAEFVKRTPHSEFNIC